MAATGMIGLADRAEIEELYARQSHAVDESDGEAWAATYTADGVFESPTYKLTATGPEELAEFARSSNDNARAAGRQFRHVVSTIVLTQDGVDRMRSRAYLMIYVTEEGGSKVDRILVLDDQLARTPEGWRFRHRAVYRDGLTPA